MYIDIGMNNQSMLVMVSIYLEVIIISLLLHHYLLILYLLLYFVSYLY